VEGLVVPLPPETFICAHSILPSISILVSADFGVDLHRTAPLLLTPLFRILGDMILLLHIITYRHEEQAIPGGASIGHPRDRKG
jgi:hypothetical protein